MKGNSTTHCLVARRHNPCGWSKSSRGNIGVFVGTVVWLWLLFSILIGNATCFPQSVAVVSSRPATPVVPKVSKLQRRWSSGYSTASIGGGWGVVYGGGPSLGIRCGTAGAATTTAIASTTTSAAATTTTWSPDTTTTEVGPAGNDGGGTTIQSKDYQQQQHQYDNGHSNNNNDELPALGTLMRMMPTHVWEIDTKTSLGYFALDLAAVTISMSFLYAVVTSEAYKSCPLIIEQALMVVPLQILTGFAMWCMWCIGHDAGHTTISRHPHINRWVGEVAHSMICLTPFRPWQRSHQLHHLGHNHLTRDYSHQWFVKQEQDTLPPWIQLSHTTRNVQLPILYLVYLLAGVPDGGHVWFYGRMWENASLDEKRNSAISVGVSLFTAGTLWHNLGTVDFVVVCMIPWLVMSFWLFMVTYLQHHSDDGKLYTDETFTFVRGAFETVDRNYGPYINRMSHHMMDGHVVHHLFFTRIPHYHLAAATDALRQGLAARGQSYLYKQIDTPHFVQEIIHQFDQNWFYIDESQIVRGRTTSESV